MRSTAHAYLLPVRRPGGTWDRSWNLGISPALTSHQDPSIWWASTRDLMVSARLLVLGHPSLLPLRLSIDHRAVLVWTLVIPSFQGSQGHLGRLVTDCCDRKSNLPGLSPHVSRFLFLCVQSNQSIDCCIHRSLHRHFRIMPARKIECVL